MQPPLLSVLLTLTLPPPGHAQDNPQQIHSRVDDIVANAGVTALSTA
ncbi:hypothetical protein [Lewinella sp. IMCC34191]|nr:hypothetical protein [Lewinella sp. IMCC34191]